MASHRTRRMCPAGPLIGASSAMEFDRSSTPPSRGGPDLLGRPGPSSEARRESCQCGCAFVRGELSRSAVGKTRASFPSATATRPADSVLAPCLYPLAVPCYPPAYRRIVTTSVCAFTPRRAGTPPSLRPYPSIRSTYNKGRASRGFVLRRWIRKAGGARDEATLVDGLADTRFFKTRTRRQAEWGA